MSRLASFVTVLACFDTVICILCAAWFVQHHDTGMAVIYFGMGFLAVVAYVIAEISEDGPR